MIKLSCANFKDSLPSAGNATFLSAAGGFGLEAIPGFIRVTHPKFASARLVPLSNVRDCTELEEMPLKVEETPSKETEPQESEADTAAADSPAPEAPSEPASGKKAKVK